MMATRRPPVDVVTVGVGLTGSLLGLELAEAGLSVVGLERGDFRMTHPDFDVPGMHDELKYAVRHELAQDLSRETITFRNTTRQTALPMRELGSFLPGEGLGGAGVHWNGQAWRFLPWDFETRTRCIDRYGQAALAEDCTSQDWGVTYTELEPHYDRFERVHGIGGKAGNLRGQRQQGGNPFEGPRAAEYPNPPSLESHAGALFTAAARERGYHPFPMPTANMTRPYTNPHGATLGPCVYCGYCERFGCEMGAKASPLTTVLPKLLSHDRYQLRTHANVIKVNLDSSGRRAVGVTYIDERGREIEQPAELVLLTSYVFSNVRLMLLSGIGRAYDPTSNQGVVGRNYAYQIGTGVTTFFEDKVFNPFMGAGALGRVVDDFNGDNFDHSGLAFVGGGYIACDSNGARPIQEHPVPHGTPRWGSAWKKAVARYYSRSLTVRGHGGVQSYRTNYLDLDPTYKDVNGLPLVRLTFDYHENERRLSDFLTKQCADIAHAMKPSMLSVPGSHGAYSIVPYQSTHNTGGAVMGSDAATSAVNRYLQSWDVPNVFVVGASAFPQNGGYNPTGTVAALCYWAASAIREQYLKQPGALV